MINKILRISVLLSLLAGLLSTVPAAAVRAAEQEDTAELLSTSMLNEDGTLNMSQVPAGPLDLAGWDVQLDPFKGPVFSPIASQDSWSEVDVMGPINKYIYTFYVDGSDLYVGGEFTNAGGIDEADKIARWDGVNWHALSNNGFGNGAIGSGVVYDIVKAGSDFYVAGNFSSVSNTSGIAIGGTNAIAKWNGTNWSSADGDTTSALNSRVSSLAVYNGSPSYLYAAGQFTNADGISAADYIARLNLTTNTWEALGADSGGDGSIDAWTLSVAVDSAGTVYAGGFFTNADVIAEADYIAKWDSVNEWQALGSTPLNGIVGDVVVDASNNLYAGGNFANAGGIVEADYIAKWNGSAWSALSNNGAGNGAVIQVSGGGGGTTVQDMQIVGNELYAVGIIGLANDATADYVIKYDLNSGTWSGFGNNGSGNGSISNSGFLSAVASTGSTLYIGGFFANVNDAGTLLDNSQNIAMYTVANSWQSLGGNAAMLQSSNVNVMVSSGSNVYIGGSFFDLMGDPSMDNLARWDGSTWHAVGNTGYTSSIGNGSVQDIEVDGNNVYIVGTFTTINNNDVPVAGAARVAKWNGSEWSALGSGIDNNVVEEVEVDSIGNVYIGGSFLNAGGNSAADRVAMWNGASWNSLSSNGASEGAIPNGNVYAMEINGTDLFVGGDFLNVVNTSNSSISNTAGLALWNGSTWSAVPNLTSPLSSAVMAITISGSDLYIGGSFNNLNGLPAADYIAKWNGSAWSALGSGGGGEGSLQSTVHTIVVRGSTVYAGGSFYNANNGGTDVPAADYIARFDGANWNALGSNGALNGSLTGPVYASVIFKGDLWVSGSFINVNNNGIVLNNADYLTAFGLSSSIDVNIGTNSQGQYSIDYGSSDRHSYAGINSGPARVSSTNSDILASTRVLFGAVSYSEMMGFPADQLTNEYVFPWYNNTAMDSQLRVSNLGVVDTEINVYVGSSPAPIDTYTLAAGTAIRKNYAGVNNGPMRVTSSATNILTTIRVLYGGLSYSELVGFPANQLTNEYIFPWYNNTAMDSQLRVSNLGAVDTEINVYVGSNPTPIDTYILAAGQGTRKNYAGVNNGPLRVTSSNTNILTTIRVLFGGLSYSELLGFPVNQLTTSYSYPVYDNASIDSQLRVSNVGNATTTITVYSGSTQIDSYTLAAGAATRINYSGVNNGPLKVVSSSQPILTTTRMLYYTSGFSSYYEMTGFADNQLHSEYVFPWYNNTAMDSQVRFAVP